MSRSQNRKRQQKGLPLEIHKTLDELCGAVDVEECEEGVWLPASRLHKLLSSLPNSPMSPMCAKQDSSETSESESSLYNEFKGRNSRRRRGRTCSPASLPPIGVFWDIENCQVPSGVSALSVVQMIRDSFFEGFREAEFVVVCDVTKESTQVVQELNVAQIDLVHVASICKNAADEKLRQALRRFAERHGSPSAVILISGDINFAADLSDLRHRKKIRVILLHQNNTNEALILCSDQNYDYLELTKDLPQRSLGKGLVPTPQAMDLVVSNLPDTSVSKVKNRLRLLSANCGGRVVSLKDCEAVMRFSSSETAYRARLRMEGEDVFGRKIHVGLPQPARSTPSTEQPTRLVAPRPIHSSYQPDYYLQPEPSGLSSSAPPMWPRGFQPPKSWLASSMEAAPQSSQFLGKQQNARSIRGRHSQSPKEEDSFESSLTSVSSWFHQGLLPPPHLIPQRSSSPVMMIPTTAKKRSPSPMLSNRSTSPFPMRADADGSEGFQPIQTPIDSISVSSPVDLQVANLDHSIDPKEMRHLLLAAFKEHVMVLQLSVHSQSDGQLSARVRVASRQDAQVAVASLHRQKIGNRRIRISMQPQNYRSGTVSPTAQLVRAQVAALLQEVPDHRLPLFKLCELYERRFLSSVSLSELHRMRDVANISEEAGGGRFITLLPETRRSVTPSFSDMAYASLQEGQMPEIPYCPIHALSDKCGAGWAEKTLQPLPVVNISLQLLSSHIYHLLNSHQGALPLHSFPLCYEAEIGLLQPDERGVPLEHLVTWVYGVTLTSSPNGGCAKMLTWGMSANGSLPASSAASEDSSSSEMNERSTSPAQLAQQISLFGREVVELLRASPKCQLSFVKFIPAYHHHFGRQCRVANYGFTRLIDLLDALPSVVQVVGEGDTRLVILAHPAQIRRFTSDLLRVLKAQPTKQATVSELPELFTKTLGRNFESSEYGLCQLEDLVSRVPQNTVVLTPAVSDATWPQSSTVLALPKRDQTPEEVERTRYFATEVVRLLRDAPQCSIPFNKFIPAYHHHFGHQCRLLDYGMTKLAELLAAVADVVEIEESQGGERLIVLALAERRRVLAEQVRSLVSRYPGGSLLLSQLSSFYQRQYGVALNPRKYGASTMFELMSQLSTSLQVTASEQGPCLQVVNKSSELAPKILKLLIDTPEGRIQLIDLNSQFEATFGERLNFEDLILLDRMVQLGHREVYLTPLYMGAKKLRKVIQEQGGSCLLSSLFSLYVVEWGVPLNPEDLGFSSVAALLGELSDIFCLSGRGKKRIVTLKENTISKETNNGLSNQENKKPTFNTAINTDAPQAGGMEGSDYGLMTWGALLPIPSNAEPRAQADRDWDKISSSPWTGKPWGLHPLTSAKENNVWSPLKLWSPPKNMKGITAPDPSELPMPSCGMMEELKKDAPARESSSSEQQSSDLSMFSDSGIGQATPPPAPQPRRRRLAAHFSSPIELL